MLLYENILAHLALKFYYILFLGIRLNINLFKGLFDFDDSLLKPEKML